MQLYFINFSVFQLESKRSRILLHTLRASFSFGDLGSFLSFSRNIFTGGEGGYAILAAAFRRLLFYSSLIHLWPDQDFCARFCTKRVQNLNTRPWSVFHTINFIWEDNREQKKTYNITKIQNASREVHFQGSKLFDHLATCSLTKKNITKVFVLYLLNF